MYKMIAKLLCMTGHHAWDIKRLDSYNNVYMECKWCFEKKLVILKNNS